MGLNWKRCVLDDVKTQEGKEGRNKGRKEGSEGVREGEKEKKD